MVNPYAPQLPAAIISLERSVFLGDALSHIAYGITLSLFAQCAYALRSQFKRSSKLSDKLLLGYTFVLFALATIFTGMNTRAQQLAFIDYRNYPGGPTGYALSIYSTALGVIPNATVVIANWLVDGMLLYRCLIVYCMDYRVIVFPFIMYLGSISMGTLLLYQTSRPTANLWTKTSVNFGLPYFSLSAALNVLLTILISIRLLLHRRRLRHAFDRGQNLNLPYLSIAAMLIESSALYAVFSLLFIGPYGAKSNLSNIFLPILVQVQIISPLLIIVRVANRSAWTATPSSAALSTLAFTSTNGDSSRHQQSGIQLRPEQSGESSPAAKKFPNVMAESRMESRSTVGY